MRACIFSGSWMTSWAMPWSISITARKWQEEGYTYRFTTDDNFWWLSLSNPFIAIMLSYSAHCCHVRVLIDRLADQFLLLYHCLSLKVLSSLSFSFGWICWILGFWVSASQAVHLQYCKATTRDKARAIWIQWWKGSCCHCCGGTAGDTSSWIVGCCSQGHPSKGHWVVT